MVSEAQPWPWPVWLSGLEHCPLSPRVAGSIPGQGTCWGAHGRQVMGFSLTSVLLPCPPSLHGSTGAQMRSVALCSPLGLSEADFTGLFQRRCGLTADLVWTLGAL